MTMNGFSATERAVRARQALAALSGDAERELAFVAAFGEGDALAALRRAADPPVALARDEMMRLRQLAFGRTASPADEAIAVEARRTLVSHDQAHDARSAALDRAIGAVLGATASMAPNPPPAHIPEPPAGPRRLLPNIVAAGVAFVAGAILAGVAVAGIPVGGPAPTAPPAGSEQASPQSTLNIPTGPAPALSGPADLGAAMTWFDQEQAASDILPSAVTFGAETIDPASTRLIHASPTRNVFVARSDIGSLCLLLLLTGTNGTGTSCTPASDFESTGLHVITPGEAAPAHVFWDGITVTLTLRSP